MTRELAGRLRERVAVATAPTDRGTAGEGNTDFAVGAPVWAAVETAGDRIAVEGERRGARQRYRVTLRGGIAIEVGNRLSWCREMLDVVSVTRDPAQPDRVTVLAETSA